MEISADHPSEKVKRGTALTDEEKVVYKAWLKEQEERPITLEDLRSAQKKTLRRLMQKTNEFAPKDLPKVLEIIKEAIAERTAGGEQGKDEKPPEVTRAEMLAELQKRGRL